MATIDKPLPNTKTTVEVPGEVEIQEAIKENVEEIQEKGGRLAEFIFPHEHMAETVSARNSFSPPHARSQEQSVG